MNEAKAAVGSVPELLDVESLDVVEFVELDEEVLDVPSFPNNEESPPEIPSDLSALSIAPNNPPPSFPFLELSSGGSKKEFADIEFDCDV